MGTRFWNCVGRCSEVHSDDEYGTDVSLELCAVLRIHKLCRSSNSFVAMVFLFPKLFGANPTVSAGNGTSADDDRMEVDSLKKGKVKGKGKHQNQKGNRTTNTTNTSSTDINTCKNCGRTGHWAKDCCRAGGGAYDNSTSNNCNMQKGKSHKKGKGKSKHVDVVETTQLSETASTVSCPSQTPSTIGELSCNSNVEPWIMGVTNNSVSSTGRQAGAEYLLPDSGAQLHACPITYPGRKVPLPDPGIHTASGARLQHDGGRLVTYKRPERRIIRVLFHACAVQKPILSLGCLAQQVYWSDLRADTGTLFFPDKIQTKHSQTKLHKEESSFCVKGMLVAPLSTAGVSDEVGQELQMPMGPQRLEDVGADACLSCNTQRSWHSRSNRDGTAQSGTLSESALVQDVRRISRT